MIRLLSRGEKSEEPDLMHHLSHINDIAYIDTTLAWSPPQPRLGLVNHLKLDMIDTDPIGHRAMLIAKMRSSSIVLVGCGIPIGRLV